MGSRNRGPMLLSGELDSHAGLQTNKRATMEDQAASQTLVDMIYKSGQVDLAAPATRGKVWRIAGARPAIEF